MTKAQSFSPLPAFTGFKLKLCTPDLLADLAADGGVTHTQSMDYREFQWSGNNLLFRRKIVAAIVPDDRFPGMWRIKLPDGSISDMVNRSRATDAATILASRLLDVQAAPEAATVSFSSAA